MRIMFDDYMNRITESASFRVLIDAIVVQTFQNHSTEEDFRLRRPDLEIEVRACALTYIRIRPAEHKDRSIKIECVFDSCESCLLQGPHMLKVGEKFELTVKFQSTMSIPLTECMWEVEAPGITKPLEFKERYW